MWIFWITMWSVAVGAMIFIIDIVAAIVVTSVGGVIGLIEGIKMKRRARQGNTQALYNLALKYKKEKPSKYSQLITQAAEKEYAAAQYELALDYHDCFRYHAGSYHVGSESMVEAFIWFERAAKQEHANAQYRLGLAYMMGDATLKDDDKSLDWFKKAAVNGSGYAKKFESLEDVHKEFMEENDIRMRNPIDKELSVVEMIVNKCEKDIQSGRLDVDVLTRHIRSTDALLKRALGDGSGQNAIYWKHRELLENLKGRGDKINVDRLKELKYQNLNNTRIEALERRSAQCYLTLISVTKELTTDL